MTDLKNAIEAAERELLVTAGAGLLGVYADMLEDTDDGGGLYNTTAPNVGTSLAQVRRMADGQFWAQGVAGTFGELFPVAAADADGAVRAAAREWVGQILARGRARAGAI